MPQLKMHIQAPKKLTQTKVNIPGSKYLANRLLIMGVLCEESLEFFNLPSNQDILIVKEGLEQLGVSFKIHGSPGEASSNISKLPNLTNMQMTGIGAQLQLENKEPSIYTHENGTFSRFIVGVAALLSSTTPITITAASRMMERPMGSLTKVLEKLDAVITYAGKPDCLPLTISGGIRGGEIDIEGSISSQYISALLIVLPLLKEDSTVKITTPLISKTYIDLTINLLKNFGITVEESVGDDGFPVYQIPGQQKYQPVTKEITVESDPVSSTYFLALSVLTNQPLTIEHFNFESPQGETNFYRVLEQMGCRFQIDKTGMIALDTSSFGESKPLTGIEIDMGQMPDAVPTLAVLATVARGTTRITNIAHLRYKESNRIDDLAHELRKTGVKITTGTDEMIIEGLDLYNSMSKIVHPITFDSHNDHRLAMSLSLFSVLTDNEVIIDQWAAVNKSFPGYFKELQSLGFKIDEN